MSTTTTELHRGDVVLIAFPFLAEGQPLRKRRPADAIAAITSSLGHKDLPSRVFVRKNTLAGRRGVFRLDSVVDCQTLATVPRAEIVRRLDTLPAETMRQVGRALMDVLALLTGFR